MKKNVTNCFNALGGVSWLWANSPLHRNWPVSLLAINTLPAIRCNQYALLMKDGFPVAFCSWANLSLKNEIKYLNNVTSLLAEDWTSGERKWFIDWIAPFGDSKYLYKHMRDMYPYDLFRAIRVNPKTNTGKISEFHGGKIDKRLASRIFRQYHNELINEAKKMKSFKFSFSG